ncbi:MAG: GNAT family N-acetyltransferase [bacterium]|nr:MAG: GNAT family N-acetyltransferase [bacterium]
MKKKAEVLKDGTRVIVRNLHPDDLDSLMKFYRSIPDKDRIYLKVDVTKRKVVKQRIGLIETGRIFRIVAEHEGDIVADGALELTLEEWGKNQGEPRVIVATDFQRKGLGMIVMRELYFTAIKNNVEKIVAKIMKPQIAAQNICRKLGFQQEAIMHDYVRDQAGKPQDFVIMTCDIKKLWDELEYFYSDYDWQRCR